MTDWISVEDRLPELDREVLALHGDTMQVMAISLFTDEGQAWWWGGDNYSLTVTHWMPLPSLPPTTDTK